MLRALYTAVTGANSQQLNIDVISNNIANVNTTGFKKSRAEFQDLLNQTLRSPGAITDQGTILPVGIQVGLGVKTSATQRVFAPGSIVETGNALDVAINGDGFFQVQLEDGSLAYSRDGNLKRDANGQLVTTDGYIVQPGITIPNDATDIVIGSNGTVSVKQTGQNQLSQVGQIQLAKFANSAGLEDIGRNLYRASAAAGDPIQGVAGQGDFANASIEQGRIENSNVQLVEEITRMIMAQRAFEANTNVIKTADQVLERVNNIG
jgi:flagellar basal-body rod protein FlgG